VKPLKPDDTAAPSEIFERVFMAAGGVRFTCDGCGREHYASDAGYDFEPGELEDLHDKAAAWPSGYIDHGDESVGVVEFAGQILVVGCPCNRLQRYEAFIWSNREKIAEYLNKRATADLLAASRDFTVAERAGVALRNPPTEAP
jgi:hypothetical protein